MQFEQHHPQRRPALISLVAMSTVLPVGAQDSFDSSSSIDKSIPKMQMATNGTIGRTSGDTVVIPGVNTRGTARLCVDLNYDALREQSLMDLAVIGTCSVMFLTILHIKRRLSWEAAGLSGSAMIALWLLAAFGRPDVQTFRAGGFVDLRLMLPIYFVIIGFIVWASLQLVSYLREESSQT